MSWPSSFRARISDVEMTPIWSLRTIVAPFQAGLPVLSIDSAQVSDTPSTTSFPNLVSQLTLPSEGIDPGNWNPTHGAWSVDMVIGIDGVASIANVFSRGRPVQLYLGFPGLSWYDFQPIALGAVENIETTGPDTVRITIGGLGQLMGSRLDRTGGESALFYNLPTSTTTIATADFTAGVSATLEVADSTGAERQTGGEYLILVTPDSGDPFFLTANALASDVFTLTAASGRLNTTAKDASIGNEVVIYAYVGQEHPVDIVLKVLTSTGTGINGAYDTLPKSWGLGIPASMVDFIDAGRARAAMQPSSGAWSGALVHAAAEEDPGAFLATWMARMGMWVTVRQGQITIRAAEYPVGASQTFVFDIGGFIDIREDAIGEHNLYHPAYSGEYSVATFIDAAPTATASIIETPTETNPNLGTRTYDGIPVYSNESQVLIETSRRMGYWAVRIPERMTIILTGLTTMQVSSGEIVLLTTDRRAGRMTGTPARDGFYKSRPVLVEEVEPAVIDGDLSVRVSIAILPQEAT